MRNWTVRPLKAGLFVGEPDPERLRNVLIEQTGREWTLAQTIREQKRVWFFCASGEHLLIALHVKEGFSAFLLTNEPSCELHEPGTPVSDDDEQAIERQFNVAERRTRTIGK